MTVFLKTSYRYFLPIFMTFFPVCVKQALADEVVDVCFHFGCSDSEEIRLTDTNLDYLASLFIPVSASANDERLRIAQAIAYFEWVVGQKTLTHLDLGKNRNKIERTGQLDCIDESRNTTEYLKLLERKRLLTWHKVVERAFRAPLIFDQHWSAQIEELHTGERYVVDSWYLRNAMPPVIMPTKDWQRKHIPEELAEKLEN